MFVLKNAWRSVVRNKGRNILIAIIVAVIAAAATIGLAIRNAAETARETGLSSTTVTATIGVDRDAMMSKAREAADSSSSSSSDATPDFDSMRSALDQESLTLDDYNSYAEASSVDVSTYYTETTSVNATSKFQPVETSTSSSSRSDSSSSKSDSSSSSSSDSSKSDSSKSNSSSDDKQNMPGGDAGMGGMTSGDFSLVGFSSDTAVANASNGTFTMSDGQVFGYDSDSDGDVIISKALAEFNNLKVGSTFTVADLSSDSKTYKLTVVGIYENTNTNSAAMGGGPMGGTSSDPDNAIYTSVSTLKKLGISTESSSSSSTSSSRSATQLSYSYVLGSKDDYETFAEDAKNAGLGDEYKVSSADVENYESSLVPLNNLSQFALTLLLIVLAVGAIVLVVLNLFNVRERKYEIGVLTAIGINKVKVMAQFVIELLIVTMIGIALGVVGGSVASVPVSNALLSQQISSQQTTQANQQAQFGREADMGGGPGGGGMEPPSSDSSSSDSSTSTSTESNSSSADASTSDQQNEAPNNQQGGGFPGFDKAANYVSEINATVNFKVIGQLILIGLALTLISALVGVIAIIRYEPLQILADRS